jgi:hypothetical protein
MIWCLATGNLLKKIDVSSACFVKVIRGQCYYFAIYIYIYIYNAENGVFDSKLCEYAEVPGTNV